MNLRVIAATAAFLLLVFMGTEDVYAGDADTVVDRQYNQIWNGLVHAESNERYHIEKSKELDDSTLRVFFSSFVLLALTLPLFLDGYLKDRSKSWKAIKPMLYVLGLVAFLIPNFASSQAETIERIALHKAYAARWNSLGNRWQKPFDQLYWEAEPVSDELIGFLKNEQVEIDNSETDVVDTELLAKCQSDAEKYLTGTLQRARTVPSSS